MSLGLAFVGLSALGAIPGAHSLQVSKSAGAAGEVKGTWQDHEDGVILLSPESSVSWSITTPSTGESYTISLSAATYPVGPERGPADFNKGAGPAAKAALVNAAAYGCASYMGGAARDAEGNIVWHYPNDEKSPNKVAGLNGIITWRLAGGKNLESLRKKIRSGYQGGQAVHDESADMGTDLRLAGKLCAPGFATALNVTDLQDGQEKWGSLNVKYLIEAVAPDWNNAFPIRIGEYRYEFNKQTPDHVALSQKDMQNMQHLGAMEKMLKWESDRHLVGDAYRAALLAAGGTNEVETVGVSLLGAAIFKGHKETGDILWEAVTALIYEVDAEKKRVEAGSGNKPEEAEAQGGDAEATTEAGHAAASAEDGVVEEPDEGQQDTDEAREEGGAAVGEEIPFQQGQKEQVGEPAKPAAGSSTTSFLAAAGSGTPEQHTKSEAVEGAAGEEDLEQESSAGAVAAAAAAEGATASGENGSLLHQIRRVKLLAFSPAEKICLELVIRTAAMVYEANGREGEGFKAAAAVRPEATRVDECM
ncbi:unnamed protein product [Amoebophrya sp. A120]|nr:unnamed protein product [Amoebophrya sp. A120]|eukprot:GSA120T00020175001.1